MRPAVRRPDGRVLTANCPGGLRVRVWQRLRRRAAWAASLFAFLLLPACQGVQGMMVFPDRGPAAGAGPGSGPSAAGE